MTLSLQGTNGHHGDIWEALPALAVLTEKMEQSMNAANTAGTGTTRNTRNPLAVAYQNAWEKLQKYYNWTENAQSICSAAILLRPSHRKQYVDHHWTGEEEQWKDITVQKVKTIWETEYCGFIDNHEGHLLLQPPQGQPSIVEQYLRQAQASQANDNEIDSYINAPPTTCGSLCDCIPWLRGQLKPWPGIT